MDRDSRAPGLLALPSRLFFSAFSAFLSLLRPNLPRILPLLVFASFIPLVLFLSASAGWIVWRNVAVGWHSPLYLQYGDGTPPYAQANLPLLVAQQRYDISLQLQVPNVDANYALGNFMTTLTLSTHSNKTLISIRRPAIVIPPRVAFYSRSPSLIKVEVPLLDSYATGASYVIANVEVGRRDGWKSLGRAEGRELSVVSASLRGVVVHHGIRGLVTRLPLLSAIVSSIIFLIICSLVIGACILPLTFRHLPVPSLESQPEKLDPLPLQTVTQSSSSSDDSDDSDEKPVVRQRGSRPSSRAAVKTETDSEPPIATIPDSDTAAGPLRRRRSRLADPVSSDSDS
ncbi:hypothetical protein C8J57DRAFT_1269048 [Mycena rebaudengoi]|nr:hypothetical protein C8J57DRAFT_1269048 [Mycena rebaudengoi]